ncbi:ribonuclease G [Orrella daihaiensis]|uniref:Ribonuclease G n=1 Tax=Orrella daihaiensis TaxID=2782176 RepID=A0ABY4AMI1_9BURK|nr:ribonuclease G [Orrella daihaiensis]UOD51493.1 ribonuclease G [Orrella daihaiensis]
MDPSTEDILINVTPFETRVALVCQGTVQELHLERNIQLGQVGSVRLGKVARVLPGMQSAFIDIGLDRAAFIHIADVRENRLERLAGTTTTPIEKLLFEGQTVMVQVIKDPLGTKGARLSTQISLAGRLLVYLPHDPHIGVSQRIESEQERQVLRERVQSLMPEDCKGGFIVRTQAEDASDEALKTDIEYLMRLWQNIQTNAKSCTVPALLYQDLTLPERVLRDVVSPRTHRILVDCAQTARDMQVWADTYTPQVSAKITYYEGERALFDLANVEEELKRALSRRVDLKSGGYLIIDQTEALTTIDVNTGGFVGGRNFDDTIFRNNLEAAHAIARQLRLRNLGGIIVIDFIDMHEAEHQRAVLDTLKQALAQDRTRTTVSEFSPLGLVEMTRKRTRDALSHHLCESCPTCQSRGQILTARSVCYEILREIMREARQFNPREYRILASQSVIDLFLDEESQQLAQLSEHIGKPISLEVSTTCTQEQYDIVLI